MHVDLSADQRLIRATAREFLGAHCPPARVRAAWGKDARPDPDLWRRLGDIGMLGLVVPERYGGTGLGCLELALVLEEAGRVALPEPLLESAVASAMLAEVGTERQRERWLPALAAGTAVATIQPEPTSPAAGVDVADVLIAAADGQVHAVPRDRISYRRQRTVDGARRMFTVDAPRTRDTLMEGGSRSVQRLHQLAAAGAAASLVGIAAHLLDVTVAYVKDRRQFGRSVGSFQAVQHRLADVHVAVEMARPSTWVAAHLLSTRAWDAPVAASVAKVYAARAEALANDAALQCHGGVGFTWDHDLHLWLKRGKALEQAYGSPRYHRRLLADQLFSVGFPLAGEASAVHPDRGRGGGAAAAPAGPASTGTPREGREPDGA